MKNVLKQKVLWLGVLLLIAGVVVTVICGKMNHPVNSLNILQQAVQKGDGKRLEKALAPSTREALKASAKETGFTMNWDFALQLLGLEGDMKLLQGPLVTDEEGKVTGVKYIGVYKKGESVTMSADTMSLMEENGKLYLNDNFY